MGLLFYFLAGEEGGGAGKNLISKEKKKDCSQRKIKIEETGTRNEVQEKKVKK